MKPNNAPMMMCGHLANNCDQDNEPVCTNIECFGKGDSTYDTMARCSQCGNVITESPRPQDEKLPWCSHCAMIVPKHRWEK